MFRPVTVSFVAYVNIDVIISGGIEGRCDNLSKISDNSEIHYG